MEKKIFKTKIADKEIIVETGAYCMQANGSCIVRCGDTAVMVNATMADAPREGMDYFPLGVDFEEKMYAIGKIPGGFKKREGRASDKAILTSRLIDRPLRPLFPKGFYNDVTVIATVLSADMDNQPEVLAMIGSSIALSISDIPFYGPTGSVVVGYIDGKYVINPDLEQRAKSKLALNLAGTKDAIMMVEAGANMLTEKEMLNAILFGHEEIKKIVEFIEDIQKQIGKPKKEIELEKIPEEIDEEVRKFANKKMDYVLDTFDRTEREKREDELNEEVLTNFEDKFNDYNKKIKFILDSLYYLKKEKVRAKILKGVRPDGRGTEDIRDIWCEVGMLPRVHGSAVFTRGLSQAMTTATLGSIAEVQKLEGIDEEAYKRYMHQYNMPGYSTGEAKPLKSPGRREIGHGALAERALEPVLPSEEKFPYAIRTVSEILSSNGSTSQASVCGSTLALMDAGVPISAPVAGIAMGLIKDEAKNKVAIMSDIQGLEDFLGDMDFKVAGTKDGITAIQMDIKIKGIDEKILKKALEQARKGRLHILSKMEEAIAEPRKALSKWAPKIKSMEINVDKIKDVIGSGGKTITKIIDATGVKVDINEEGKVYISAIDENAIDKAKTIIESIVRDAKVGDIYEGKVVKILENEKGQFGACVELGPTKEGMIHISKLSKERVSKVTDVVNVGDIVLVKIINIDDKFRIDLSLKKVIKQA